MMAAAGSAPPPGAGGGGADSGVPDVTAPKVVHRVKSKMGYTEMHTTAPGFGENVGVQCPLIEFTSFLLPTNLGQPTHSHSALTELPSPNLAPSLLLD